MTPESPSGFDEQPTPPGSGQPGRNEPSAAAGGEPAGPAADAPDRSAAPAKAKPAEPARRAKRAKAAPARGATVLYDAPGPKARRRALIGGLTAALLLVVLLGLAGLRLADKGQFDADKWTPLIDPGNEYFDQVWALIGKGLANTLRAAVLSVALSLVIGTALGVLRIMSGRWSRLPLVGLIELFRGLPVVLSIYLASKLLPQAGVDLSGWYGGELLWYLVIALVAYNSVIIAEIVRAGVVAVPKGQREASLAVGLTNWQTMRLVQLPQAFRTMLPALISQLVVIVKDTSLVAVLGGYIELLRQGNLIAQNLDNPIQTLFVVAVIYILINFALSRLAVWTERRLSGGGGGKAEIIPGLAPGPGAGAGVATI
jgi:glutamate transport system permease protein